MNSAILVLAVGLRTKVVARGRDCSKCLPSAEEACPYRLENGE
jgi:hypothetical protein